MSDFALTPEENDVLEEVGQTAMGSGASTLSILLNQQVTITSPTAQAYPPERLYQLLQEPSVLVEVPLNVGNRVPTAFFFGQADTARITDLMMGGEGSPPDTVIDELRLSAISEAVNQMMGMAANSLTSTYGRKVEVSPPQATVVDRPEELVLPPNFGGGPYAVITYLFSIEGLVESQIYQLFPSEGARDFVQAMKSKQQAKQAAAAAPEPAMSAAVPASPPSGMPAGMPDIPQMAPQAAPPMPQQMPAAAFGGMTPEMLAQMQAAQMQAQMAQMAQMGMAAGAYGMAGNPYAMGMQAPQQAPGPGAAFSGGPVAQPVTFGPLGAPAGMPGAGAATRLDLIMDVPLRVTVELGRTRMQIRDVLELGKGSVVGLDKLAGEPVDLLVNGKLIARGEVVVIDENFGIRVTDIVSPAERVSGFRGIGPA
ncbi:MAG: flagellar motor switch phosphatase FliY [Candidatus Sericytochromatia bacterium]|nr:flagellar motor switch phosphatase FliY [Candidatus Tanganyikabacteria bacterium]